ncbi:hypothetical protein CRG98_033841 [Punica granatum]|uniref:DDE Tnp4 domain-containing protein n=2 Tax=Punica granatum TaxID=22663 RepID=A0A2I0IPA3_PUNGR|nr:hypothetical protein CRG98_033841 [Punica granatum]
MGQLAQLAVKLLISPRSHGQTRFQPPHTFGIYKNSHHHFSTITSKFQRPSSPSSSSSTALLLLQLMMESTDFPFLNHEFDYTHLLNLFQDAENLGGAGGGNFSGPFKRQRTSEETSEDDEVGGDSFEAAADGSTLREVLASFMLIEEKAREDNEKWAFDFQEEKSLFDLNPRKRAPSINDYYQTQLDSYCIDQLSESPARRSASLAAAGATMVVSADNSPKGDRGERSGNPTRRLWVKDRSKDWWEQVNSPNFPDSEFKRAFRMSRATFNLICDELDPAITKKNTTLREAIPVHQRVAVCIWRLATGEPLRLVSKKFGLGISTCHKLVLEVCNAIRDILLPKFVQWPGDDRLNLIKSEFEALSGIPNIGGSMYTTHIPIIAPKSGVSAYYNKRHTERNQKTSYSVTVQGVMDHRGVFTDVSIGWPGSYSDDQVLERSTLFKKASSGLLQDTFVAGNTGYPLMDWVLVPYSHKNLTWTQHAFNEKLEEALNVSKEAFCRLKGRWACLQKRTEVKLQDLPVILGACCVLHNVCEIKGEEVGPELRFEVLDDEVIPENSIRGSPRTAQARDQIAHNIFHHGHGTAFL